MAASSGASLLNSLSRGSNQMRRCRSERHGCKPQWVHSRRHLGQNVGLIPDSGETVLFNETVGTATDLIVVIWLQPSSATCSL